MEEPGRLQSMGSLRVGHYWATSLSLFPFMHWRRKLQPTPVFLPGESQGRGTLVAAVCGITQSRTWLKWLSSSNYCVLFNTILGDILGSYLKPPLDPNLIFWQNPNLVQSCKIMWPGKMMDLYQFKLAIGEIRSPYHWLVWGKSFYCVVTSELWSRLNVGSWEGCF